MMLTICYRDEATGSNGIGRLVVCVRERGRGWGRKGCGRAGGQGGRGGGRGEAPKEKDSPNRMHSKTGNTQIKALRFCLSDLIICPHANGFPVSDFGLQTICLKPSCKRSAICHILSCWLSSYC